MDAEEKRLLLSDDLPEFCSWSYNQLEAEIERTPTAHDCLRHIERVFDDDTVYQMESNVFWDDHCGGAIRVCGDISTETQQRLAIYSPDLTDLANANTAPCLSQVVDEY